MLHLLWIRSVLMYCAELGDLAPVIRFKEYDLNQSKDDPFC